MVYDIEINLPDDMAPVAVNNDRLITNGGAILVEDVDDEDEAERAFDDDDRDEPVAAAPNPIPLPHVPPPPLAGEAPRRGSRSRRSGAGNQPYNAYLNLNTEKHDEGTALLNDHTGARYKLRFDPT